MGLNKKEQELLQKVCDWAYKYRLSFHPTTHILEKVKQIASKGGVCICDDKRTCPCTESLTEIGEKGSCLCRLFCEFQHGQNYLIKYDYIDFETYELKKEGQLE